MRDEYDIKKLNPRKNPYASMLNRQITISIDRSTADYLEAQSETAGIPCQTLINMCLRDCAVNNRILALLQQTPETGPLRM